MKTTKIEATTIAARKKNNRETKRRTLSSKLFHEPICICILAGCAFHNSATAQTPELELLYTGDWLSNRDGGLTQDARYLTNIDAILSLPFASLFGQGHGELLIHGSYNSGKTFSQDVVGDAQTVSNIEADRATRLYQAYYRESAADQRWQVLFGLWDLNSEIDVIEPGGLFLNSSQGIGPDFSQSGANGPSIFPVTSLSLYGSYALSEDFSLRGAILDAVPGDPEHPDRTTIKLDEGALLAAELEFSLPANWLGKFGSWYYSEKATRLQDETLTDHAYGSYLSFTGPLLLSDRLPLAAFLRVGAASESVHEIGQYLGAGLVAEGLFARRPEDALGLALAIAYASDDFRTLGAAARETNIELTYSAQIRDWLRIQPNLQYVRNPGFDHSLDSALVLGVRLEFNRLISF